ncbi:MAG: TfoX/Sxy family DNA transformation protein [Enterobacterales bacterium endosymbiont of Blomia tropicalis]|uniref:TfoX/Sxy family DNA transformation protein n=1 Tax=Mixta mediterraneensis TaxID=2758443 RepID=UPI0025A86343|nr:TfoX/Sxy family DNA transformation protein [Mixta mediterraneensis]MDL4913426.1 TfoX/Sxy family DNA transformation protein [Mixta mediterraneensis]
MKKAHQVVERSRECLASLGKIESRTQFGGYALAVEQVVFALINEDELYLRASEALREYVVKCPLETLVFRKRGIPVNLNYFKVDEALWCNAERLIALSASSLQTAQSELQSRHTSVRLKDLPNLSLRMELMLREVGICTVKHLCETGAKQCWLKLKAINQHVGLNTLLALQGAISGHHHAALPQAVKAELSEWYQNTVKHTLNTESSGH